MIDLVLRGAGPGEWEELCRRARSDSVQQELIEVLEMRGRVALARGDLAEARASFEEALAAAARIPNVIAGRIERQLAAVRAGRA
jgi:hypothetical protein